MDKIVLALLGTSLSLLVALTVAIYKRRKKLKAYYHVIWEKSSSLEPKEVLKDRPFHEYYHLRTYDSLITKILNDKKHLLVLGSPLSGKTRSIYETLKNLQQKCDVAIPRCIDINLDTFTFPKHFKFWRPKVLVLDDLHRFVEVQNFDYLIRSASEKGYILLATCRSDIEFKKVKSKMLEKNMDVEALFSQNIVRLENIPEDTAKEVANKTGVKWGNVKFDGTIGSIFMHFSEMEKRFDKCNNIEKTILRALRLLYLSGIYEQNLLFPLPCLKTLAQKGGLEGKDYEWSSWLEALKDKGFLKFEKEDRIWAEETYLEYIVKPTVETPPLTVFEQMISIFVDVPDALFRLGNRVRDLGAIHLDKVKYMKVAVQAFQRALQSISSERSPMNYAAIQSNLGNAYGMLAEVEAKVENCKNAIRVYREALKIRSFERFPIQFATTQINLGAVYETLAGVEAKVENCKKAIMAAQEALRVFTLEHFPTEYAMTQSNLGNAYRSLSEVEAKTENCKNAIRAFQQALKVFTSEHFSMDYARTQNNLGAAYGTLAVVEAKVENCKKAIQASQEALKVFTLERFPIEYAITQNNLGNSLGRLAEVEVKAENCKKAIRAFMEALKVFTLERFPMDYAMTQSNLGAAYRMLATVEDKAENCKRAIQTYHEALKVRTLEHFPMDYATTQNNIGTAYRTLSEVETKEENCKKAILAYQEALKVRTLEHLPFDYAITQSNLANACRTLAEVEAKTENCTKAIKAYEEALKVFNEKEFPEIYSQVIENYSIALAFCKNE